MLHDVTDTELLERWSFGDVRAGSLLLQRHRSALYGFLGRRVAGDVEDLAQQTLLACIEQRQAFRGQASFRTYLLQIARYQLYAYYRTRQRDQREEVGHLQDDAPSPSQQVMREQELNSLSLALTRLAPMFREVLLLTFFEALTGPEISERLGIPIPTVRSRTRRGLAHLRAELAHINRPEDVRWVNRSSTTAHGAAHCHGLLS